MHPGRFRYFLYTEKAWELQVSKMLENTRVGNPEAPSNLFRNLERVVNGYQNHEMDIK